MTREQALACSLEWLELLAAAVVRRDAATSLMQMQCFNVAQGGDKNAWDKVQRSLIERAQAS